MGILYNRDIFKVQVRSLEIFENTGSNEAQWCPAYCLVGLPSVGLGFKVLEMAL